MRLWGSVPISSRPSPHREETITTVVKSPRGRRQSPSKSPSRYGHPASLPRPGLLAPELPPSPEASRPSRPEAEPGWRPAVPTLFVTEPETHTAGPKSKGSLTFPPFVTRQM